MSYHDGSVWPHDSSLIAAGFAEYARLASGAGENPQPGGRPGSVDLMLFRSGHAVAVTVERRDGDVDVVVLN
jgi:hypothetical protein